MQESNVNQYIKDRLKELSEPQYRKFNAKLLPGTKNILGVRLPAMREIAKEIAKGDYKSYLKNACDDTFEEIMIRGMTIGYIKAGPDEIIGYLNDFVPRIDNWSVCDSTANGIKAARKHPELFFELCVNYCKSGDEFFVRFATVMYLSHFINDEYIDRVLLELNSTEYKQYYAQMAAAWAVSVCYVKYPDKTLEFLKNCNLDDFTFNKSIQKIKESYRVDKESKIMLGKMIRREGA